MVTDIPEKEKVSQKASLKQKELPSTIVINEEGEEIQKQKINTNNSIIINKKQKGFKLKALNFLTKFVQRQQRQIFSSLFLRSSDKNPPKKKLPLSLAPVVAVSSSKITETIVSPELQSTSSESLTILKVVTA